MRKPNAAACTIIWVVEHEVVVVFVSEHPDLAFTSTLYPSASNATEGLSTAGQGVDAHSWSHEGHP